MKRKWNHPEEPDTGRELWRSTGELEKSSEFQGWLEREFPQGAAEMEMSDESRRSFVKLMGASVALAGFGAVGCSRPVRHLIPFNEHVEWLVPGKALYYASAKPRVGGRGCDPLVVTTYDGRPTKVDGNKLHPSISGGSDAHTQASVLDMYDPDRSRGYLKAGNPTVAADFESSFLDGFRKAGSGEGVAFLVSENSSPTRARLLDEVTSKYSGSKIYTYEALGGELGAAENELFGEGIQQVPNFSKAEKILSLDCDFLGLDKLGDDPVGEFSAGREPGPVMNRLYAVEPAFSLTGGMADHRYRAAASQILQIALLIAKEIGAAVPGDALSEVNSVVYNSKWIAECAKDLKASNGKALVVAGSRQPKAVHAVVAAINDALGAFGGPIALVNTGAKATDSIADLARDIAGGKVKTLFVSTESDPVFDAPADLGFGELFGKVANVVHIGVRQNQTALAANWHVPGAHYLEGWGDFRTASGVYSVQQPMIRPLWGGVSEIDFFLKLLEQLPAEPEVLDENTEPTAPKENSQGPTNNAQPVPPVAPASAGGGDGAEGVPVATGVVTEEEGSSADMAAPATSAGEPEHPALAAVKETFEQVGGGADWNEAVRNGFAEGSKYEAASGSVDAGKVSAALSGAIFADLPHPEALEVQIVPSHATYDGRYANNAWMQEAPDPITKLTWDNAALIGFGAAKKLGLEDDRKPGEYGHHVIDLVVGDRKVTLPVLVSPGTADYTLQIAAGYYGKDADGMNVEIGGVGSGVGFNVNPIRTTAAPFIISGATFSKAGYKHELALTSEHYSMEGRAIYREATNEDVADEHFTMEYHGMDAHIPPDSSLYQGPVYQPETEREKEINEENREPALEGHAFWIDPDHQWAMTVDLNSCIGCNACTIACQSENNIPIVGKHQVLAGREMHWIRMDRYFSSAKDYETVGERGGPTDYLGETFFGGPDIETPGKRTLDEDNVEMLPQPVACQQCESAPCETVCPVNATVHTSDGLNAMTYNRCIGTRYCANNCPYKARRFNYFDYNKRPLDKLYHGPLAPANGRATTTEQLQKNPNVTVRMRGVIEKCTYCVQRISKAKIAAKVAAGESPNTQVPANSVTTACQDACPAESIQFGNLNAKDDRVNELKKSPRNYDLLRYVGTRPRTSYLGRIKNPNPAMPKADKIGQTSKKMH
ncbi:MAG: TAT-variant-translocated molybdopterin oxidoreductase [Verrucomicrobiales bacterium]|nr:TAT-variant-translocated molybdopterin oxidoreductase [Verrucomicrobiales bacterium]